MHKDLAIVALGFYKTNDLSCSNQEIVKISFQGQNLSMFDRGLLDFLSMIDTL